jgi:nucleoside-diphosphate-sugar epimerase
LLVRVVITGATGNVGTSVVQSLSSDSGIDTIVGLARHLPKMSFSKTEWATVDVASSDLVSHFRGAHAVIHLAWLGTSSSRLARLLASRAVALALLLSPTVNAIPRAERNRCRREECS